MSISKLPNELVSEVLSYLAPDTLLQVAVTSKLIHRLSFPFFELAREWRSVRLGLGPFHISEFGSELAFPTAASFLKKILEKPQLAQYVTHVDTDGKWDEDLQRKVNFKSLVEARNLADAHDGFQTILQGSPYFEGHVASIRDSLLKGLDGAFFCLLLVLLPNIQKLDFWNLSSHIVSATIWRIVNVVVQAQNVGNEGFALSHLKTVRIRPRGISEGEADLDFAIPFAGLPSVRTLCGHMVRGRTAVATAPGNAANDHHELCQNFKAGKQCPVIGLDVGQGEQLHYKTCSVWPHAPGLSLVETLLFDYSDITPQTIELLLPAFKNLRRFEYKMGVSRLDGETFVPQSVVKALLKYQAHSLQHLEITNLNGEYEPIFVDDLREFQVLKFVSLDMGRLSKHSGPTSASDVGEVTVNSLIDFLPPSIETLCFTSCDDLEEVEAVFEGFAERRADALPKLKRLCFVCGLQDVMRLAEKIGREAGLEVEILQYERATNTKAMEAAMDDFLERWSQGQRWRAGDPHRWVIPAPR